MTKSDIEMMAYGDGQILPGNLESIIKCQEDTSLRSPGIPAHYYRFFFRLFSVLRPNLVVELGTSYGHSSACMADGNPDGRIITVNNRTELREECRRDNVTYLTQDSLEPVDLSGKMIDVLFIDTDHDGIRCEKEFEIYKDSVVSGGLIFFDDITLFDCMKAFWEKFNPEGFLKFEIPAHGSAGFGCLIKR